MKKTIVIYSNCQGQAISELLKKLDNEFTNEYDVDNIDYISNYQNIVDNTPLDYDKLSNCDLFIYQPISSKHGIFATDKVKTVLKESCIQISFPYIYNYAFWEILVFRRGDHNLSSINSEYIVINHEPIINLKNQGVSLDDIKMQIISGNFDFKFKERYEKTLSILREHEKDCTIKVADFIDKNHKDIHLFYTQNHITAPFVKYMVNKILDHLGYSSELLDVISYRPFYADYYIDCPIGKYAYAYYKFKFMNEPEDNTIYPLLNEVSNIYNNIYIINNI